MSLTRKIAGHSVFYGSAQILIMLSGVISMPILTRVLTEEEYGLMNLIGVTLLLTTTLFSGGLRHSIARLYGEYREQGTLAESVGTYLICVFGLGLLGFIAATLVFPVLVTAGVIPRWALPIALMASPLVFIRLVFAGTACVYRMREQVIRYNALEVATKYVAMGLCIWLVLTSFPRLFQFFRGLVLGEAIVLAALCIMFFGWRRDVRFQFTGPAARGMLRYGLPLMAGSLASVAFRMGDRYVIKLLLDARQVAYYSVGAQLASYTSTAIVSGFSFALVPVIMNAWNSGKRQLAQDTLGNLIRYYALAAFPIALGLVAVRMDLIRLIASDKYLDSAPVMPLVVGAAMLGGFQAPLLIGLHFARRTGTVALLSTAVAALNILLNIALIAPNGLNLGIVGAGIATLACSALYIVVGHLFARPHYSIAIPWTRLLEYAAASAMMYMVVIQIDLAPWGWQLAARIVAGIVIYVALVLILDRRLREYITSRGWSRRNNE